MNERILELWSQAGGHYNSGNQHTWPEYTIDDPEKFAELIVRECISMADKESERYSNLDQEYCSVQYLRYCTMAMDNYRELVRKHFGVEE